MMSLIEAPRSKRLRIFDVLGGHGIRRRLMSLGFHKDDEIVLDSRTIFRGPILIKNLSSDTSVAIGRGIAQKIMVEIIDDEQ